MNDIYIWVRRGLLAVGVIGWFIEPVITLMAAVLWIVLGVAQASRRKIEVQEEILTALKERP